MIKETYRVTKDGSQKIVRVGTAYEKFAESLFDIDAYLDFVKEQGFEEVHLSGHSLGAPKAAYYLAKRPDAEISSVLFLSPADMWVDTGCPPVCGRVRSRRLLTVRAGAP